MFLRSIDFEFQSSFTYLTFISDGYGFQIVAYPWIDYHPNPIHSKQTGHKCKIFLRNH
jgi:hypothetical protein